MKEFFSKFIGFSVGPVIGAIIGFITVPVTSYLIAPDQFGLASMFNLANTILTLLVLIGIDQAYMREYNEYEDKGKLLFNSMIMPLLNTIFIAVILVIFRDFWANLLFDDSTLVMPIILLAICSPFFIIEKFMLLSIRMEEKALKYSIWNIVSKSLNLLCLVLLLLCYKRNFESVVYATILSQFIVSILLFIIGRKKIKISKKSIDKKQINRILKFGLPLIPATLIGYGLNSMDTVFLRVMTDYTEIGYYSMALKISNLLTLVQTSFTTFWAPIAFKWNSENVENKRFEIVGQGITLAMSIILIVILMLKDLIPILVSKEYAQVIYILPFLLFYPIFYTMSETTTLGISFSRKTGYNIVVSIISMIVNVVLNYILISWYGAVGAAIATGISYLVFFWTRTIISRRLWYKFPIRHFIFVTIALTIVALCNVIIKNIFISECINVTTMIIIILRYKGFMKELVNLSRKKKYVIGLICFDTQKEQLKDMIENEEIEVIDLTYKGKIKKLVFTLIKMMQIDMLYQGYGAHKTTFQLKVAKLYRKKVICHWIGTDILIARKKKNIKTVQNYITYNLACSPLIQSELKELGIESEEVAILPGKMNKEYSKLPDKHRILAYLPERKEEFYGIEEVKYVAQKYSNIEIYIVGNSNDTIHLKNVKFLGKIPYNELVELYDKVTILMRIPKHDGLSLMLLEALIKGKEVLYCYDFPFTRHIESNEDIDVAMEEILSREPYFNEEGHNYILDNYNIAIIKKKLYSIIYKLIENKEDNIREEENNT